MDLGTTIIAVVIMLICILPFALMSIKGRKKQEMLLQGLFGIAEKNNCKISRHELWNSSTIGIDDTALMIFFTRRSGDNETSQQINLAEIQKCRVINSGRTVSTKDDNFKVVEKLELAFSFQDKNKNEVVLECYNADHDSLNLSGELQLVEKWCKIFNDKIAGLTKQKR